MVLALASDADADDVWFDVVVQSNAAPPGEYLLFRSVDPPTSIAGLDAVGALACRYDCALSVPGLGALLVRDEALGGTLVLPASVRERSAYLTLVRRGTSSALAPMKLEARARLSTSDDGCGGSADPPPPSVAWSPLSNR